ncbi:MAG TPA: hypothetical protein PK763_07525, partial [Anaerolineaceae bacterium]|nr:hypothetical protein [Anaerolineaceae bacterium]
ALHLKLAATGRFTQQSLLTLHLLQQRLLNLPPQVITGRLSPHGGAPPTINHILRKVNRLSGRKLARGKCDFWFALFATFVTIYTKLRFLQNEVYNYIQLLNEGDLHYVRKEAFLAGRSKIASGKIGCGLDAF